MTGLRYATNEAGNCPNISSKTTVLLPQTQPENFRQLVNSMERFLLGTNVEMPPRTSVSLDSRHAELLHHYHPHHIREHGVTHIVGVL